jgi:hypothetical protein
MESGERGVSWKEMLMWRRIVFDRAYYQFAGFLVHGVWGLVGGEEGN